ncbi:MAG: PQQ-binding-like beta-propeller repeat protein [Candidatus Bathyarchaeia archaeon]
MKTLKNKIVSFSIAIFLILSMMASMTFLSNANAHSPPQTIPTYAFINVAPNPVGIGQKVTVAFWLAMPSPSDIGSYGDRWHNMTVTVTQPDGKTETLGPFTSDATGGTFTTISPAVTGNYTFQMHYGGQTLANVNPAPGPTNVWVGDYFQPSNSQVATLTVQQQPITSIPNTPLPTQYWQNPINAENSNWYVLGGSWLGFGTLPLANTGMYNTSADYNPYTTAPTTGHILWTKPEAFGGTIGGEFGGTESGNYYSTANYEPKFAPIIINGVLYYEEYPGASTNPTGFAAVNLRTGQTIWAENTTAVLRCGQLLDFVSPNQFGALAYLWSTGNPPSGATTLAAVINTPIGTIYVPGSSTYAFTGTTYNMYDAMTGNYILSIVNGTSMMLTEDANGDLIGYYIDATNPNAPTLNMWNSTQALLYPTGQAPGFSNWLWRPPQDYVIPFSAGIMWSAPIANDLTGVAFPGPLAISAINSGVILMTVAPSAAPYFQTGYQIEAGYSATNGQQLWITNRTQTPYTRTLSPPSLQACVGSGVYVEFDLDTNSITGCSLFTGKQLWTGTLSGANTYDTIGGFETVVANGTIYVWGFGGDVWAVDLTTGTILWHDAPLDAGYNTPYGVWPLWTFFTGAVAGGLLFVAQGHEYSPPLFHGAQQLALNTTNGKLTWSILGFDDTATAIADGIMTTLNAYDNQIYGYGMGPSKTTVTAPDDGATTASTITISGTVTDISAGASQEAVAANFPNGLPCVSDASMTQFMEAVYEQQLMPTNITGVPVTINVLDSNGNYRTIGTTTTDASGFFSFNWKPDIAGNYTVTAVFAGTQSYYGSSAQAAFYANAPSATQAPTATPLTGVATQTALEYGIIAIIIVIIIIGSVLALLLTRKHP